MSDDVMIFLCVFGPIGAIALGAVLESFSSKRRSLPTPRRMIK